MTPDSIGGLIGGTAVLVLGLIGLYLLILAILLPYYVKRISSTLDRSEVLLNRIRERLDGIDYRLSQTLASLTTAPPG